MTTATSPDVIDRLAGASASEGAALDALRRRRAATRLQAQRSHEALFEPAAPADGGRTRFTHAERFAIALFVAQLHAEPQAAAFYAESLEGAGGSGAQRADLIAEAQASDPRGPYGRYPLGPLSVEDRSVPEPVPDPARRNRLGQRLAAALVHARLLVLHPRDAKASDLQALLDAGWSTTDIITLSQLVSFLSFQIRAAVGLRVLGGQVASTPVA